MALKLDNLLEEKVGVKVGIARMIQDGSVRGLARAIESQQGLSKESNGEEGTEFLQLRRLVSDEPSSPKMLFISGFGLLAETASDFVASMLKMYTILICEFAGIDSTPAEISLSLLQLLDPLECYELRAVVAFSAGGAYAFEMCKILSEKGVNIEKLWLLDCFFPQTQENGFQDEKTILRFITEPFSALRGVHMPIEWDLSVEILMDHLEGSLVKLGRSRSDSSKYANAVCSKQMIEMLRKLERWKGTGILKLKVHYIKSLDNTTEEEMKWQALCHHDLMLTRVDTSHFKMLKQCARIMKNF